MKQKLALSLLFVFALLWPIVYVAVVHDHVAAPLLQSTADTGDLKDLFNVRRYTITIPMEDDGRNLAIVPFVDGLPNDNGGASVRGGAKIVLLIRRDHQTARVEYCWKDDSGYLSRGYVDDPLSGGATSMIRGEGPIAIDDWIFRGGRNKVDGSDNGPADFELRLALKD